MLVGPTFSLSQCRTNLWCVPHHSHSFFPWHVLSVKVHDKNGKKVLKAGWLQRLGHNSGSALAEMILPAQLHVGCRSSLKTSVCRFLPLHWRRKQTKFRQIYKANLIAQPMQRDRKRNSLAVRTYAWTNTTFHCTEEQLPHGLGPLTKTSFPSIRRWKIRTEGQFLKPSEQKSCTLLHI